MPVYATTDDLGPNPPENAEQLIEIASARVRFATRYDLYAADGEGLPTRQELRQAMRGAVIRQVQTWTAAGIDPAAPSLQPEVQTSSAILSGSITHADAPQAAAARTQAAEDLSADVYRILDNAGLARAATRVIG